MKEYNVSTFEIFLMETPNDLLPEVLKKLKKAAISRKSYYKNWEKQRERNRKYRENNPDKIKEVNKKYREDNPEKERERNRIYKLNNPKKQKKNDWKRHGLNMEHFEEIYEIYMITTHCDLCGVELTVDKKVTKTTKCMDHSHVTGEFRNIICHWCNTKLPRNT